MANNVSVNCVGFCKEIRVIVCGVQVAKHMYVILAKGEGYPVILGRPWLIAMSAKQDWEKGTLVLKPPGKGDKPRGTIVYSLREGRQEYLSLETSKDEWSTKDS